MKRTPLQRKTPMKRSWIKRRASMPMRKQSPSISAKLEREAIRLWSSIVHARANERCEMVNAPMHYGFACSGPLDPHHVISRRWKRLCAHPDNGILLCRAMHDYAHARAAVFMFAFDQAFPARKAAIAQLVHNPGGSVSAGEWRQWIAELKEIVKKSGMDQ